MASNIPFEIWSEVATYLPACDLKTLYPVNHAFFELAMAERYRAISFWDRRQAALNITRLEGSPYAHRIRSLHLWSDMSTPSPITQSTSSKWRLANYPFWKLFKLREDSDEPETTGYLDRTLQVITCLRGVNELSLHWMRHDESPYPTPEVIDVTFLPVVTAAWMSFGWNLQRLTLDITLESYRLALSTTLVLPRLEDLSVKLSRAQNNDSSDDAVLHNIMIPFVNNHHLTLQSLDISSEQGFDISSLVLKLQHFPCLWKFSASYPIFTIRQADQSSGLRHVLETHSDTLRSISFRFQPLGGIYPTEDDWHEQAFLSVKLPSLESADLCIEGYALRNIDPSRYLQQYANSLTSVTLHRPRVLVYEDVERLVGLFAHHDRLRSLDITVHVLNPHLLDLIAEKLPSLGRLALSFTMLLGPVPLSFGNAMLERSYPSWKLRHITTRTSQGRAHTGTYEEAIARAIPTLITFNSLVFSKGRLVEGKI